MTYYDGTSSAPPERGQKQAESKLDTQTAKPRGRPVAVLVVGGIVALGFLGALGARVKQANEKKAALAQERSNAQAAASQKPVAKSVRPESIRYRPAVEVTGSLQPWRSADIGFEYGGRLLKVGVSVGDVVKSGTVLAVLDGKSAAAQVNQAQASTRAAAASLAMAEDNLRRSEALVQSKAIPEAQAEQSRQQVALARAQLEASRATTQLAQSGAVDRTLTAPFDGLITKAPTSAGGVVSPGAILVHIEDHSRFRLSVTVSEDDAQLVRPGAPVTVAMRDRTVTGKIATVVPSLDQGTRRAPVEVEVANDPKAPLLAWSFVHAKIDGGAEIGALKIPANARRPGSQTEIVKLESGRARFVHVVHGTDDQGNWLVRDGLAPTDTVLVNADPELKDGDVVEKVEELTAQREREAK
jgi:RND family efflux transporter MFP subunit